MEVVLNLIGRVSEDVPKVIRGLSSKEDVLNAVNNAKPWQIALGAVAGLGLVRLLTKRRRITRLGRRVVVTGAASGIGKDVARRLASQGWRVFACDVNEKGLDELRTFPNVTPVGLDVRKAESCQQLTDLVGRDGASLDALVNVAGVVQNGPACGFNDEQIQLLFDVNTLGPMRLCRMLLPIMLRTPRGGSIVNVTSVGGRVSWPWSGNYSPSKAALNLFSDSLRRECKGNNLPIKVSVVAPGAVLTPMVHAFIDNMKAWVSKNSSSPFAPGVKAESDKLSSLQDMGLGFSLVAISPERVTDVVVDVLNDPCPGTYYLVATLPFKIIYYAALFLPVSLADRLLLAM